MSVTDAALVRRAQQGDEGARTRLLRGLEPILRGYFIKRAGYRAEIDDLVQNTLLRVHNSLDALAQPEAFKGFAMKAAFFELQDLYRGRYRTRETLYDPDLPPADPAETTADGTPGEAGLRLDLARAMQALSEKARQIIELRELGYQYIEIAEMLDTTEAAIKMQVMRAFRRLRDELEDDHL